MSYLLNKDSKTEVFLFLFSQGSPSIIKSVAVSNRNLILKILLKTHGQSCLNLLALSSLIVQKTVHEESPSRFKRDGSIFVIFSCLLLKERRRKWRNYSKKKRKIYKLWKKGEWFYPKRNVVKLRGVEPQRSKRLKNAAGRFMWWMCSKLRIETPWLYLTSFRSFRCYTRAH